MRAERWQQVIDQLLRWYSSPRYFKDEDFEAPSPSALWRAMNWAVCLRDPVEGFRAPESLVPLAEGGVVFEWLETRRQRMIFIRNDGDDEVLQLIDGKVAERSSIATP
jgi:hypothetical protein